ncbi:DUF4366 domain-containing protein [Clostridium sporogenes]|uniref:DUF4366 domain-containing protein n=1 Tax=Clostridium sporogenes TaxID=1509 RepID=A0ABX4K545_CLOSG|nr:DUF4366 domain-containing protein [Clostridium sporogenes]KOY66999.1 hypothetical protein AN649_05460 [Clostridium sporogenes]MBW5456711.1 DUF4366 domain-containing protein [Clostridium sporogenes]MDS1006035.1 DUF4366 domain-containing protein [Clostridium sporogenes]NFF63817.1 DUF4366 domain-containing protein [Clostridium sporogenes]NFH46119.1 DUF4366 domain-containing protein [Clostridium sporogenes]
MKKFRMMAVLCAAFLMAFSFSTVAYASGGEETPEVTEAPAISKTTSDPNPFTPDGTGTVVNTATDEDGKQFYTITTPDENVFYLVIDLQRKTDNVYFLNAVTEKDLLALAEKSEDTVENETAAITTPEQESSSETDISSETSLEISAEPEQKSNPTMLLLVLAVVAIGGGAGYYFKIYRPKQERAALAEDEFDEYEADPYDEQEDNTPPWEVDGEDEDV